MDEQEYTLRQEAYRLGRKLRDYELTDAQIQAVGEELIVLSGFCPRCDGAGTDGDGEGPPEDCPVCQGSGMVPGMGPQDWPEDLTHENGNCNNRCCICGVTFTGHKRRVVCRVCQKDAEKRFASLTPEEQQRELWRWYQGVQNHTRESENE